MDLLLLKGKSVVDRNRRLQDTSVASSNQLAWEARKRNAHAGALPLLVAHILAKRAPLPSEIPTTKPAIHPPAVFGLLRDLISTPAPNGF